MSISVVLLKYITTWVTMVTTIIVLLSMSEVAYEYLLTRLAGREADGFANSVKSVFSLLMSPIRLPDCASPRVAIIMPVLAIAAFLPVCSSISFITFSPLLDNGGDILQIIHFTILSEVFAMTAVYALGTERASHTASRMTAEFAKLAVILTAAFASFALYFTALGIQGNPFSLDVFSPLMHWRSLDLAGRVSVAVFVFLALCHTSHRDESESGEIFSELPLREYCGLPRALLQIWAALKSFLIATLITHIFFPWFYFSESETGADTFWAQLFGFMLFWLTVIITRTFGVMLCRNTRMYLEKKLPQPAVLLVFLLLLCTAVGIIYYEAYVTTLETF